MSDSLTEALRQSTTATFENLAMLIAETTTVASDPPAPLRTTHVLLEGGTDGCFVLELSPDLLPEIAVGMLGPSAEVTPSVATDVLGELANVIAGNLLAHLAAAETTRLSSPSFEPYAAPGAPAASARFAVDDGFVGARLYLSHPANDSRSDR